MLLGLSFLAVLAALSGPVIVLGGQGRAPNILVLFSDDHGSQAVSAYSTQFVSTPNIDRLAKEGVKFNNAMVTNSLCGPSRAVLLTGKYSNINGFRANSPDIKFNESQDTFPKQLRKMKNYHTRLIGKYHLNTLPTSFDHYTILKDQGEYFNPGFYNNSDRLVKYDGHVTDVITALALEYLRDRTENHPDQPWLLMVHHKAPHRNAAAPLRYLGRLRDKRFPLPKTFFDDIEVSIDVTPFCKKPHQGFVLDI